jgi:predicted lipid-binding transport protein (Tim44 family)
MQAANDAGQVDDLRKFTTPELFASLRADLLERGSQTQQTDVIELNTAVVEAVQEHGDWIISVRFHGRIREDGSTVEPFDELWHLVRPLDASRDWAIAGIQQRH